MVNLRGRLQTPTKIISYSSLPTASAVLVGIWALVPGGTGDEDVVYICIKAKDDNYHWVPTVRGGEEI